MLHNFYMFRGGCPRTYSAPPTAFASELMERLHHSSQSSYIAFHTLPNPLKRPRRRWITCSISEKKVLILGGTGRVGSEAANALLQSTNARITLASRNPPSHHPESTTFTYVDITDAETLIPAIRSHDLILHTAGPFQHSAHPSLVLERCLECQKPYIDISDDMAHSVATKSLSAAAKAAGTAALISTGIYPGLSNLLAVYAVSRLRALVPDVETLDLYYHTAGSGGIGETVLAATMLLLSEQAMECTPRGPVYYPAASGVTRVDFGPDIGEVHTYRLNLPEVYSLHDYHIPNATVSARFSTAPPIWNLLLQLMARLPRAVLSSRPAMQALAKFSMPIVKTVDRFSGARTAIVVRVDGGGREVAIRFVCERLDRYVGSCTAAFAKALLDGRIETGVWFPEELPEEVRERIIADAVGDGKIEIFVDGTPL